MFQGLSSPVALRGSAVAQPGHAEDLLIWVPICEQVQRINMRNSPNLGLLLDCLGPLYENHDPKHYPTEESADLLPHLRWPPGPDMISRNARPHWRQTP